MTRPADPRTRLVRAALDSDPQHGAVVPPLHLTSTFSFAKFGQKGRYDYSRSGNPTRDALGEALAELEGGAGAVVTASGMAAVALVAHLCRAGETVLVPRDCYGGTFRLFTGFERQGLLKVVFVDPTDLAGFAAALAAKPRFVWLETPSNPLLRITDIAAAYRAGHKLGNVVLTERTDNFHDKDGNLSVSLVLMGRFEMDGPRIVSWRDYFDTAKGF